MKQNKKNEQEQTQNCNCFLIVCQQDRLHVLLEGSTVTETLIESHPIQCVRPQNIFLMFKSLTDVASYSIERNILACSRKSSITNRNSCTSLRNSSSYTGDSCTSWLQQTLNHLQEISASLKHSFISYRNSFNLVRSG
jgi:hypothetical protein